MSEIEIIYKEGNEYKNNIWKYMHKSGVWALFGLKSDKYECLNVGKSIDVGGEVLYNIGCLHNLDFKTDGMKRYINQFGEDCGFDSVDGLTQEYLYPYIKTQKYGDLLFLIVHDESNRKVERILAWLTHALYWRNGKSFESTRENYYKNQLNAMIENRPNKKIWKTDEDIIRFLSNTQWT